MTGRWAANWAELVRGIGCPMCGDPGPDDGPYGPRIYASPHADAILQNAAVQRGYTVVVWRGGRHATEPTDLTDEEASAYWRDVLAVARALITHYAPLKMNYETLGNAVPHLHTHLVPRYADDDPAPGRPFPLPPDGTVPQVDPEQLGTDAAALRALLA